MIGFARIYARSQITEDHPPFVYNECTWIYGQHEYSRLSALFYNVIVRGNHLTLMRKPLISQRDCTWINGLLDGEVYLSAFSSHDYVEKELYHNDN